MALIINSKAQVFNVVVRKDSKDRDYVTCTVAFNSKSKDAKGNYTIKDKPLYLSSIAFGKLAKFLAELPKGQGFVEICGKMYNYRKGEEFFTRFDIMKVSEVVSAKDTDEIEIDNIDIADIPL